MVSIDSPAPGQEVIPDFHANGTTENTDKTDSPTTTATAASDAKEGAPDVDLQALEFMEAPEYADLQATLEVLPGFLGLAPILDGSRVLVAQFDQTPPTIVPPVDLPDGWSLETTEVVWQRAAFEDVETVDITTNEREGPPLPEQATGIGPGSRIHISGVPGSGTLACTANFVWEDQDKNLYLGAAGHCWMPDSASSTHPPGADYKPPSNLLTRVCVANCNFGGQTGFIVTGQFVTLGELVYARQAGAGGDRANDFGLVRIPDHLRELVRPDMPVWDGPHREQRPGLGSMIVHYGSGVVFGEAWPTMGRAGVATVGGVNDWMGVHPSSFGDSGSALSLGVPQAGTQVLTGEAAAGVITHISCCPGTAGGPTINRVQTLAQQAGLEISLVTQGTDTGPFAPEAPRALVASSGDGFVELDWDEPAWDGGAPVEGYTVYWGIQEGGPYPDSMTTTDTEATVTDLANNQTYFFVVSASNDVGESPSSNEASAMPGAEPPFTVEVKLIGEGGVVHDWIEADSYDGSSWHHDFTGTPAGATTLEVRLLENGAVVSENQVEFTVVALELDPIGDKSVVEGQELVFTVSASHPDDEPVQLSAAPLPQGAIFTDNQNDTGAFEWAPAEDQVGEFEVTFTATKGGLSDEETITIEVHDLQRIPFVNITNPQDQDTVDGTVQITGVAGHSDDGSSIDVVESGASSPSHDGSLVGATAPKPITEDDNGAPPLTEASQAPGSSLSFAPGEKAVLWLHGEEVGGVGHVNIADVHDAQLLSEPPHGTTPVKHTGVLSSVPVVLASPSLEESVLLGNGDPETVNSAVAPLHLSVWTVNSQLASLPVIGVQLRAVNDDEVFPLAVTWMTDMELPEPIPSLVEFPLELGNELRVEQSGVTPVRMLADAPINPDGDLVIPEGYRLEFEIRGFTASQGMTFSVYYDSEQFDSHVELPVSPKMGFPEIVAFDSKPTSGAIPFDVEFTGVIEPGFGQVDRVEIDPGDRSDPISAPLENDTFQAMHTYTTEGIWNATATVFDTEGGEASATSQVEAVVDEGVYVEVGDESPLKAVDTSAEGDWSSWELAHDFGEYQDGTEIGIQAVYFDGNESSAPHSITVTVRTEDADDPEAVIEGPDRVRSSKNATFDGTASRGDLVEWHWDFGDGTIAHGPQVVHAWRSPGPKDVTLTVHDSRGMTDSETHRVIVQGGRD